MLRTQKTTDILVVGLLILLLTVSFLARSPYAVKVPLRDSGIFLNIGSEILHGKILYQQTWDNKQPLLYVINALGLWFGSGSVWGVWGLELLMLVATIVASYYLIRPALTPLLAFAVITIAFLGVFPFMGGNYSEEYSVVFQLCNLSLLFGMYLPDRKPHSRSVASLGIGMLTGIVFCIKQTYLDIPITVMVYLLFLAWVEKNRRILGNLLLMGLGFLVINIPIFLYFQVNGALRDYVIDAFLLNLYYSELSSLERINSVIEKVKFIASHPFFFLTASLWLGVLVSWLIKTRQSFVRILGYPVTRRSALMVALVCLALFFVAQIVGGDPNIGFLQGRVLAIGIIFGLASIILYLRKPGSKSTEVIYKNSLHMEVSRSDWHHAGAATLLFLGLVDFPLAILTISLSGKLWTHYYVTLYPAIILLLSGSLAYLSQYTETQTKRMMLKSCVLAVLVIGAIPPMLQVVGALSEPKGEDARSAAAAYLKSVTTTDDTILVWGWESVIYFLAEREAPTRFALPFVFYLDTPYLDVYADTLLDEVKARPPAYLADLMDPEMPLIGGRSAETCLSGNQMGTQKMVDFLAFICANYEPDRDFEEINIYKLRVDN